VAKESKETVKEPAREKPKTPEPLSEEELAKKTTAIIDEYANIRDMRVKFVGILYYCFLPRIVLEMNRPCNNVGVKIDVQFSIILATVFL
jgi:hypothetical protein